LISDQSSNSVNALQNRVLSDDQRFVQLPDVICNFLLFRASYLIWLKKLGCHVVGARLITQIEELDEVVQNLLMCKDTMAGGRPKLGIMHVPADNCSFGSSASALKPLYAKAMVEVEVEWS
jgi:hypothetical protein